MATNLALQLQVIEPDTDLNSIMIGNSNYNDDVWDLRPFITAKSTKESHKYIRFEYITDADMKETVKQYTVYCIIKLPKVANQKRTLLHVHFGHNCKALYHGSQERCCA